MTAIAWDGKILAVDKQSTSGDTKRTSTKMFRLKDGSVAAICGGLSHGLYLLDWYKNGAIADKYPTFNVDKGGDFFTILVIAKKTRRTRKDDVFHYEYYPHPIINQDAFMAWGGGREFAIGAMAAGASAIEAVKIANKWCEGCGRGVISMEPYGW